jgi:glycosyltransferase involved in cell wall biosynthesis
MLSSIVIPLYNKAEFISFSIQSVLNQSYQDFEIIVVDDGSEDDSVSLVQAIPDRRIKLVQQENMGVSCARNKGIEIATGDLVCFLDADDWYMPAYLETIVSMAERYPDIPCFATRFKNVYFDGPDQAEMFWDPGDTAAVEIIDDLFHYWRFDELFFTSSVAIRRQHLAQFEPCFPPGEQSAEDLDLWFRLAEKSRIAYCPAPLVAYRRDVDGSLVAIGDRSVLMPAFARLEQRALARQLPDKLRNSALKLVAETKITVARMTLINGQWADALMQLINAWRGMGSKRWWVSLMMCMIASPVLASRWEQWRHRRKRLQGGY